MAGINQIILSASIMDAIVSGIKVAGQDMRVERKELSAFSGKSEVLNKYAALYKTLCEAIELYCDLVEHDATSIKGVCDLIEAADAAASGNINQGFFLFGAGGNGTGPSTAPSPFVGPLPTTGGGHN